MMANVMWNAYVSHIFTPTGSYTIKVVIDADNLVEESNENNNELTYTANIQAAP